jgi:hypothetical protein
MDWKALRKFKNPRHYLRPKPPSRREKIIGYTILLIIASIGTAIFISGRYYDPNLFQLDPKLLNKSAEDGKQGVKVEGGERRSTQGLEGSGKTEDPLAKTQEGTGEKTEAVPAVEKAASSGLIPADAAGAGWERSAKIERFTSDNLYDKIDGRENLYKSYEFHELQAADFVASGQKNRFIQVELFDMTSPKSALGIFSVERPAKPNSTKIGRDGYTDTNGVFFWKGKYYVRVIGSDTDKSTQQAANSIARTIADRVPDMKDDIATADPLPKSGQVPNSFSFVQESAFGQSFFRSVYSARYKVNNIELTGFVMNAESPAKAKSIIDEFGKAMGADKMNPVGSEADAIYHTEVYGSHYVIFARGSMVGGVMEADDKDAAIKLARQIAEHVKAK